VVCHTYPLKKDFLLLVRRQSAVKFTTSNQRCHFHRFGMKKRLKKEKSHDLKIKLYIPDQNYLIPRLEKIVCSVNLQDSLLI
jgi:hypothetical protein